jgi:hypothetical protein
MKLCEAMIRTACISVSQFRPVKIPPDVRKIFEAEYLAQSGKIDLSSLTVDTAKGRQSRTETVI